MNNPEQIGIVTTTKYPNWDRDIDPMSNVDKVRGDLSLLMLHESQMKGAKILVVDSDVSSQAFKDQLENMGIPWKKEERKTMSGARREAIDAMRRESVRVIVLNDPEKVSVIKDGLELCSEPILDGTADIVIPRRDPAFLSSYPSVQMKYEQDQNKYINKYLRELGLMKDSDPDFDWLVGVRFLSNKSEVTDLFMDEYRYKKDSLKQESEDLLNPELWPNGQYIPVIAALKRGLRVKSVTIPYVHPATQTTFENIHGEEFTKKRKDQVKNVVVGCVQAARYFADKDKVLIEKV